MPWLRVFRRRERTGGSLDPDWMTTTVAPKRRICENENRFMFMAAGDDILKAEGCREGDRGKSEGKRVISAK